MPSLIQRSFSGGEVAPALYGRADTVKYQTGLRTCRNFIVMKHGGVTNRPGLEFVAEAYDGSRKVRLLEFVFNAQQTYTLEFGHLYMRVIQSGALVVNSATLGGSSSYSLVGAKQSNPCRVYFQNQMPFLDGQRVTFAGVGGMTELNSGVYEVDSPTTSVRYIEGVTQANPAVVTSTGHGFATGDKVYISGVSGMTQLNGNLYTVTLVDANSFSIGVDSTGYGEYLEGGQCRMDSILLAGTDATGFGAYTAGGTCAVKGATQTNPVVISVDAKHSFEAGTSIKFSGVGGMTELNGNTYTVANPTDGSLELQGVDGTGFTAFTSGGTGSGVYRMSTPYTEDQVFGLQFVQSGDVITIVHPDHDPRDLTRSGHASWSLKPVSFAPSISPPTNVTVVKGPAGGKTFRYKITAVKEETLEESLASEFGQIKSAANGEPTNAHKISWTQVDGALEYNVYREANGVYAHIGVAQGGSFRDEGYEADVTITPPIARNPFEGADDKPSAVAYFQQRRAYASSDNAPEKVWLSRTGDFHNFTIRSPLQDDDAVTFVVAGRQVNRIRHLVEIGRLVLLTSGGEWVVNGDSDGVIRPTAINLVQHGYSGTADVAPIIIGNSLLYVQARGGIVRDLRYDLESDGYAGNDLTVFAPHLFEGFQIVDWDYQQIPHSVVWVVRDDGNLVALTYLREHEIWGWHRHDTKNGAFESVAVVPEGDEDYAYFVVRRTINGQQKRYIERLRSRRVTDIAVDAFFVDCGSTYDGRNTDDAHTMTLSGGTTWDHPEELTLTSSASYFSAGDVGNAIVLTGSDGTEVACTVTAYTSGTVVTVRPNKLVPEAMRNAAISDWSKAVDGLTGLDHLEGETVSILADGNVHPQRTVSGGAVALDRPYSVVHVGLPITSQVETLDLEIVNGETLADKNKRVNKVTLFLESSRGVFAGPDADHLYEYKQRAGENYGEPIRLLTGTAEILVNASWTKSGRVLVQQSDPLPITILSIVPSGLIQG